jgi:mannosyl-3-phosphoglycerate phosphatase
MEEIARALGLLGPLVVENGGALVIPGGCLGREVPGARADGDAQVVELGAPRAALVIALAGLARECGAGVRSFAQLSPEEVQELTGLSGTAARLALAREYDEPFLLDDEGRAAALAEAAERRGLRVTRGGRFFHLTGATDKGRALRVLVGLYEAGGRRFSTVAIGDSENDLPLLQAAERPIVIPRPGGRIDAALALALPEAERAPEPGPAGWNAAVLAVLAGERLPAVGGRVRDGA